MCIFILDIPKQSFKQHSSIKIDAPNYDKDYKMISVVKYINSLRIQGRILKKSDFGLFHWETHCHSKVSISYER